MGIVGGLPVELRKKDERERAMYLERRVGKDIAQPDDEAILVQTDGVIQSGKRIKVDFDFRKRRPRADLAVRVCKNQVKLLHVANAPMDGMRDYHGR